MPRECLLALLALACLQRAAAYTDPQEVLKLLALRDELSYRGLGYLLGSWKCPTSNPADCDPCGKNSGQDDSWGYLNGGGGWEHIACRTYDMTPAEFPGLWHDGMNISRMGVVTTIHLCDLGIEGTLESMRAALCPFSHLREFDVDGSHFTGPVPRFLVDCFPHLKELDLSHGRLQGSLPEWVGQLGGGNLEQFKVEDNALTGTIPAAFAWMPRLRALWLHHNDLAGSVPSVLGNSKSLLSFDARYNPRLCGVLPTIRVDWLWQWRNPGGSQNWFGFCDKASTENTACGVLLTQGTHVGRPCDATLNNATRSCGAPYDQCGGAPSPRTYKGNVVGYDTFKGPRCCEAGSYCKTDNPYFHQCTPSSVADNALDGKTDLALMPRNTAVCASNSGQCGGAKGLYQGPDVCCDTRAVCTNLNYYVSMCLYPDQVAAEKESFGANLAAQQSVVDGWKAARTPPPGKTPVPPPRSS